MGRIALPFKRGVYKSADVGIFIDDAMIRFLRLTDQHSYHKELIKGLGRATIFLMNESKRKIREMKLVYTGFMASNIISWMDPRFDVKGNINSYVATKAWYDVLVHEGLGIHANPPKDSIPARFRPTAEQLAVAAPQIAAYRSMRGRKHKGIGRGPRPFLREAVTASRAKILDEIGIGFTKALRASIGSSTGIPKHRLDEVMEWRVG